MNKQALINKIPKDAPAIALLKDTGGEVIGKEVDENNQLQYVVRNGDTITVEKAENRWVVMSFPNPEPLVKVHFGTDDSPVR